MADNRIEHQFKVLVIGDPGVGKTCLVMRYVRQIFNETYKATIHVDFARKILNWSAGTTVNLHLWDIAGQERSKALTRAYYNGAAGAIIVFDVTRDNSSQSVKRWKQEIDRKVLSRQGSVVPCILIGSKCDVQQRQGLVSDASNMEAFCRDNNFLAWFECSAKENINIDEAMNCLVRKMMEDAQDAGAGAGALEDTNNDDLVDLNDSEPQRNKCTC